MQRCYKSISHSYYHRQCTKSFTSTRLNKSKYMYVYEKTSFLIVGGGPIGLAQALRPLHPAKRKATTAFLDLTGFENAQPK
jgi:hypothetical protein